SGPPELPDSIKALMLEVRITYGQSFINNKNVGTPCCSYTKREPHLHSARIHAYWLIDVLADFREALNLWHKLENFFNAVAKQLARHKGILSASEIRVKPHPELKESSHAASDSYATSS